MYGVVRGRQRGQIIYVPLGIVRILEFVPVAMKSTECGKQVSDVICLMLSGDFLGWCVENK